MPYKDLDKKKQYHAEYMRQYRQDKKYKEKEKQYIKQYQKTEQGRKSTRIAQWKQQGILFHDYDLLYEIYLQTSHCDECNCQLNNCEKSRKCVDHDHSITYDNNVRNILCASCNSKRG